MATTSDSPDWISRKSKSRRSRRGIGIGSCLIAGLAFKYAIIIKPKKPVQQHSRDIEGSGNFRERRCLGVLFLFYIRDETVNY